MAYYSNTHFSIQIFQCKNGTFMATLCPYNNLFLKIQIMETNGMRNAVIWFKVGISIPIVRLHPILLIPIFLYIRNSEVSVIPMFNWIDSTTRLNVCKSKLRAQKRTRLEKLIRFVIYFLCSNIFPEVHNRVGPV